jgi:iron-sulfur cluster assembly accessory protein
MVRPMTQPSTQDATAPAFAVQSSKERAPVALSAAAARRIAAIGREEGRALMLRIAVEGGGCSGFQYQFDLVEAAADDDLRIERDGAAILVDEVSLPFLKGAEVDFVDELAGAEFRIRNPNAKSSCGCGVSFSI